MIEYFWLCTAALVAGMVNAVAGGGTILTFPSLISALKPLFGGNAEAAANITSTIALLPSTFSSTWAFRRELEAGKHWLKLLLPPSIFGSILGSLLLVVYPEKFKPLVPWLLLTASLLFLVQPLINRWLGHQHSKPTNSRIALVIALQFCVAVYGGYFGAGIGILMLSALGIMGMSNLHEMNAIKAVMGASINGTAALLFIVQDLLADGSSEHPRLIYWPFALAMMGMALLGGYLGARYSRLVPSRYVRYCVIAIGFGLVLYYLNK